jgi:hypothetical protein
MIIDIHERVYSFHIGIVDADKKQEKTSENNKMNQRRLIHFDRKFKKKKFFFLLKKNENEIIEKIKILKIFFRF